MLRAISLLVLLFAFAVPAWAQEEDDAMETQRCIWRCLANSKGADDPAYHSCVSSLCNDQPAPSQQTKKPPQSSGIVPPGPGVWGYGRHPRFGLAAYVTLGHDAFGLACNTDPNVGWSLSVRMTPGLVATALQSMSTTSVFSGPFEINGGDQFEYNGGGYLENKTDYCTAKVDRLKSTGALVFINAEMKSITYENGVYVMDIEQGGQVISISTADDMRKVADTVEIPLQGSTSAIDRLIQSCPKLVAQVAEGCEMDE